MGAPALADGEDGRTEPPPTYRVGVAEFEVCRLKGGCYLIPKGTTCGEKCWARITER